MDINMQLKHPPVFYSSHKPLATGSFIPLSYKNRLASDVGRCQLALQGCSIELTLLHKPVKFFPIMFDLALSLLNTKGCCSLIERYITHIGTLQNNTKLCVRNICGFIILYHLSPLPPFSMHSSLPPPLFGALSFLKCVSFYLIHPQPPLHLPALDRLTHTHTSSTDCLSSIFCSTLHHNTNRWITFLAPE